MADNPAHDLANKFAEPAAKDGEGADDARRKADEAEMLERARQEAAERAEAERRAAAESEARQREMEAQREAEARALSEKLRRAEEARRAKAAEAISETAGDLPFKPALTLEDRAAKPQTGTADAPLVVTPPEQRPAEIARDAAPRGQPMPLPVPPSPPAAPAAMPPSDPPRDVARGREEAVPPPMALGRPIAPPALEPAPADPRVTVLLVMEPGKKGIRRFNKTADPVLCEGQTCFVSNGAGVPARAMTLRKALGPGNTFGQRAGACRSRLTCVFRGVTLAGAAPVIQPVDLKVLVHDRREARVVSGDASCQVLGGRLSCGRTVVAPGYRAWIVPESVAEEAGPQALEAALMRGLVANPAREASLSR